MTKHGKITGVQAIKDGETKRFRLIVKDGEDELATSVSLTEPSVVKFDEYAGMSFGEANMERIAKILKCKPNFKELYAQRAELVGESVSFVLDKGRIKNVYFTKLGEKPRVVEEATEEDFCE